MEELFRNVYIETITYFVDQFDNENKTNTYSTLFVELISRRTANKSFFVNKKIVTTRKERRKGEILSELVYFTQLKHGMKNAFKSALHLREDLRPTNKSKGNANRRKTDFLCKQLLFVFILFKDSVPNTQGIVVRHLVSCL